LSQPEALNAQKSAGIAPKRHVVKSRGNEHFQRKTPRSRLLSDLRGPHDGLAGLERKEQSRSMAYRLTLLCLAHCGHTDFKNISRD
jgi:hypothetical protein